MNMYLHELRALRKSAVIWTCVLLALAALYLSIYPSMAHDAGLYKKMLEAYPPAVRAMLGLRIDSLTSLLGYYGIIFAFISLCGAIEAMNFGISILSKESRERTADFLLTKPVSRAGIVTAKLLAGLTALLCTWVVFYAGDVLLAHAAKPSGYNGKLFFLINLALLFLLVIFFTLGFAVSVFFRRLRSVLPVSLGIVFALYFVGALLATGKHGDIVRFFSPFQYFRSSYIVAHTGYELRYLLTGAAVAVVSAALSYTVYLKKDIHAAS